MKDYLKSVLEEFDKKFGKKDPQIIAELYVQALHDAIKSFISQVLTNYGLGLRKEIEKKIRYECDELETLGTCGHFHGADTDINQAFNDILVLLPKE